MRFLAWLFLLVAFFSTLAYSFVHYVGADASFLFDSCVMTALLSIATSCIYTSDK